MKKLLALTLALALLLTALPGCGAPAQQPTQPIPTQPPETTQEPTVPPTVPADGNEDDVTCKGSYTAPRVTGAVAATLGRDKLSNGVLQVYYWLEVAQYRQSGREPSPDFSLSLDVQACPLDSSVNTWQQYFLKKALNTWALTQTLVRMSEEVGLPTEEEYQPDRELYAYYEVMEKMPAARYFYRFNPGFTPNTKHQAWLDTIPDRLKDLAEKSGCESVNALSNKLFCVNSGTVQKVLHAYNLAYMYYTNLGYYVQTPSPEAVESHYQANAEAFRARGITRDAGKYVDFRQILLIPEGASVAADGTVTCPEEAWAACEAEAEKLLEEWADYDKSCEGTFADLAVRHSQDLGSAANGGLYTRVRRDQLTQRLDAWCFSSNRQVGETSIFRSEYGVHILYFSGSQEIWYAEAEDSLRSETLRSSIQMEELKVNYKDIVLGEGAPVLSTSDVLYPDVAHERFPEIPLYIQQDYPGVKYGGVSMGITGCGITSLAMISSYLLDVENTPPQMVAQYSRYGKINGTDGMIFIYETPAMGLHLRERTYNSETALKALAEGCILVSLQGKGYWTTGGHYIVVEKLNEDGTVQVRDPNFKSFYKIPAQQEDRHTWKSIITGCIGGYWIFEPKCVEIQACSRCGAPDALTGSLFRQEYRCEKCREAVLRREAWLGN